MTANNLKEELVIKNLATLLATQRACRKGGLPTEHLLDEAMQDAKEILSKIVVDVEEVRQVLLNIPLVITPKTNMQAVINIIAHFVANAPNLLTIKELK